MSREFKNYLIRRGMKQTESGSDCFLAINRNDHSVDTLSASELYAKKNELGIELNKVYESRSRRSEIRPRWVANLNISNEASVDIFKVNSYRVDFDGAIGLNFVETSYGNNQFQLYLPYNYRLDVVDINYPAYILNASTRVIIVTDPRRIKASINKAKAYFNDEIEKDDEKSNWITIDDTIFDDFAIIDDRDESDKNPWGTFEHPSKDLMMLIRLLIRAGWIVTSRLQEFRSGVYTIEDLDLEVSSSDPYGCEVIDGQIRRFTKYSDDLWVEIPITSEGLTFIKPKEKIVYDACKDPYNKKEYTADIIIRTNTPSSGVYFTGFNLEENYTFTTKTYNAFDALVGNIPQYKIEALLSEENNNNNNN